MIEGSEGTASEARQDTAKIIAFPKRSAPAPIVPPEVIAAAFTVPNWLLVGYGALLLVVAGVRIGERFHG